VTAREKLRRGQADISIPSITIGSSFCLRQKWVRCHALVIVTRLQFSPQYRPAQLFPLFLLIFSPGTRYIACLINFSK